MLNKLTFILASFALIIALTRQPLVPMAAGQLPNTAVSNGSGAPVGSCISGSLYVDSASGHIWPCTGSGWIDASAGNVPSGLTAMVVSGSCPTGYTESSALNANVPYGTI